MGKSCFDLIDERFHARVRLGIAETLSHDREGVRVSEVETEVEVPAFAFLVRIRRPDGDPWYYSANALQVGQEIASFGRLRTAEWLVRDVLGKFLSEVSRKV